MTLPPLPEPNWRSPTGTGDYFDGYTANQMREYAAAAVAAERERCLEICASHYTIEGIAQEVAADIRKQEVPR